MARIFKVMLVVLVLLFSSSFFVQAQTTEIAGKVVSTDGEPLPGVEVTISSPALIGGPRSYITDAEGKFRFPALLPGVYEVQAQLQGFVPQKKTDIRLSLGQRLLVDFVLKVSELSEEVTVIAEAPLIDVRDSQTATTNMRTEFIQKLPNRSMTGALDYAPGSYDRSTYGSPVSNSNKYQVDGVSVNDPEAGESAFDPDYDSLEEINVLGVGAPAEYDGFSGAVVSGVMKSGGNEFHGTANLFLRHPSFHSTNWEKYPYLMRKAWPESYQANFNLGGPFIKDKLWFFLSGRYGYSKDHIEDYTGPVESWKGGRFALKLTWQPNPRDRISLVGEVIPSKIFNYGTSPLMAPEANTNEPHRDTYYHAYALHMFSDSTLMEVKVGGFYNWGENEVDENGAPAHLELTNEYLTGNFPETYYRTSFRLETNVSLSHYAEDFIKGDHDFKFGAEIEFSKVHVSYSYPGGRYYLDYNGEPYIMDEWDGEEARPKYTRLAGFIQDSWVINDRLTINPGVRINFWRGYVPGTSGAAWAPKLGLAPRLGLTFDLLGDKTTILKAHYGKYYHGLMVQWFMRLQSQGGFREYIWGPVLEEWEELPPGTYGEQWILDWEDVWEKEYSVDPDLKFPFMRNYVVGIERQLGRDISLGASFIYRTNHDLQDRINLTGMWEETTWTCPYPGPHFGETYTVYRRLNPGENQYLLTNPKAGEDYGAAYPNLVPFTPTRNYRGLQLTFEKRYSNGWMLNASYTLGRAWGNSDNTWGEWGENRSNMLGASTLFSDPNYQINAEGRLGVDPTHLIKVFGAVDIPIVDISMGVFYSYASGSPYTTNLALPRDIAPDPVTYEDVLYIFGEERGQYRYPGIHNVDLRFEKYFQVGNLRVGALVDVFNLLNDDTITEYETSLNPWSEYQFQYVWGIRSPRTYRLAFRVEF